MTVTRSRPRPPGQRRPGPRPRPRPARVAARERPAFRGDIEGLRAVAVVSVVLGHAGVPGLAGGYVGVDVFFVISGFLITRHLHAERRATGRIRLAAFYGRRMVRLLPAAALAVAATVAAAWAWLSPPAARAVSLDAITAAVYGVNVRLAAQGTDYLDAAREPSPLQHCWSLAVEEQFYLVWPLLLLIAGATRRRAVTALATLAAVSLAICVWQTTAAQPWAYFGLQARAWELAAGGLIALLAPRLPGFATWPGLAMIVAAALWFDDRTLFPGYAAVLPVAGAALVVAAGRTSPNPLLGAAPLRWIGRLSYGWYLWHWPALVIAAHLHDGPLVQPAAAIAALLPAWLSLHLVENPIRFGRLKRHGLVLGAAVTALTAGAATILLGLPTRVPGAGTAGDTAAAVTAPDTVGEARTRLEGLIAAGATQAVLPRNLTPPVAAAARDSAPGDRGCLASLDDTSTRAALAKGCDRHGDPDGTATMVLFGDSHTEQWFEAADRIARRRHWRLVVLAKSGCTPADALTIKLGTRRVYRECSAWREDALAVIARLRPALVVLSTRTYTDPPTGAPPPADTAWAAALTTTAQRVAASAARVVLLQDTPDPRGTSVPDCVAAHPAAITRCALPAPAALHPARRAAIERAARAAGVTVTDPAPWFCTAAVCPAVVGNTLVYRDGSHVTSTYVRLLTPLLEAALPG
ncbi:acyltransferase family protein [Dactylosporangium sp. CA-139114]|uniref:acyltransferase family protein n=1 Tax=Dactylosporangium sp. CA-139114 TaxID=3239931 RepID=UPI003D99DFCF